MERCISYLSNTVYSRYKKRKNQHVFNVFTQVGVKQLIDFLRTVTAASDLVDCTLVNCEIYLQDFRPGLTQTGLYTEDSFRMKELKGLDYKCSVNKGNEQLQSDLRLCFRTCKKQVFSHVAAQ